MTCDLQIRPAGLEPAHSCGGSNNALFGHLRNAGRVAVTDNYYFNCQEFYEFNLCNQSLKITFDDCDCLPFDSFFRAVVFN